MVSFKKFGRTLFFRRVNGKQRLVGKLSANGIMRQYDDNECLVYMASPYGRAFHFEGRRGFERKVCCEKPDGSKDYFDGECGAERLVRSTGVYGVKRYYDGAAGDEHLVRKEWRDGCVDHFVGKKGAVALQRREHRGCTEHFDLQGHVVRVDLPDGRVHITSADGSDSDKKLGFRKSRPIRCLEAKFDVCVDASVVA